MQGVRKMNVYIMDLQEWVKEFMYIYQSLGWVGGALLCYFEAFFPFLPLSAFIVANSAAFGFWGGFFLSAGGSILGAWSLYGTFRFFGHSRFFRKWTEREEIVHYRDWLEHRGLILIILFMFFPIFPNSVVTVVAGLTRLDFKRFAFASAVGISGLTLMFSTVGFDIPHLIQSPLMSVLVLVFFVAFYFFSVFLKKKFHRD